MLSRRGKKSSGDKPTSTSEAMDRAKKTDPAKLRRHRMELEQHRRQAFGTATPELVAQKMRERNQRSKRK